MTEHTIRDLAKMAGVSVGTVSRVLNEAGNIDPEIRERTLEAIRQANYQLKPRGRRPVSGAARPVNKRKALKNILVIAPEMTPEWASHELWLDYMSGVKKACQERGYAPLACMSDHFEEALAQLSGPSRIACGAMLKTGDKLLPDINKADPSAPIVGFGTYRPELPIPQVSIDDYEAGACAANALLELGHREIAFVSVDAESQRFVNRSQGFAGALKRAGVFKQELIIEERATADRSLPQKAPPELRAQLKRLLEAPKRPTAIMFVNDWTALGFYKACEAEGLRIPEDFSVMGMDDMGACQLASPPLSSVALPFKDISYFAANTLFDMIEGAGRHLRGRTSVQYMPAQVRRRASLAEVNRQSREELP